MPIRCLFIPSCSTRSTDKISLVQLHSVLCRLFRFSTAVSACNADQPVCWTASFRALCVLAPPIPNEGLEIWFM